MRLWVDGELLIDEWHLASGRTHTVNRPLSGLTEIRIAYYAAGGDATLRFWYELLDLFAEWQVS